MPEPKSLLEPLYSACVGSQHALAHLQTKVGNLNVDYLTVIGNPTGELALFSKISYMDNVFWASFLTTRRENHTERFQSKGIAQAQYTSQFLQASGP